MIITPSPLVSELRGTAGGAVASTWKGRNYARRYTIPKNPNTVPQQLQRAAMADMAPLYRSIPALLLAYLTDLADTARLTAFNLFTKTSIMSYKAGLGCPVIPGNPGLAAPTTLVAVPGVAPGAIDLTWVQGACPTGSLCRLLVRNRPLDEKFFTPNTEIDTTTVETLFGAITGLVGGQTYEITLFTKAAAAAVYSGGITALGIPAV